MTAVLLTLLIPVAGLALLIIGLRKRSAARRLATGDPGAGYELGQSGYDAGAAPAGPKPGIAFIAIGSILLVVGALAVAMVAYRATKHPAFTTGSCFTTATLTHGDRTPSNCSNPDAVLQFAATANANGDCPDGKRDDSAYLSKEFDKKRDCFALNLIQGDCYVERPSGKTQILEPASCGAPHALRVVKRIDGRNDASQCPPGSKTKTYPEPARTYCAVRAGAA